MMIFSGKNQVFQYLKYLGDLMGCSSLKNIFFPLPLILQTLHIVPLYLQICAVEEHYCYTVTL